MRRRTAWLILLALVASGCNRLPWQEYTSAEGGFRVLLPGAPQVETVRQETGSGSFVQHAVVVCRKEGNYHASYADLPTGMVMDFSTVIQSQAMLLDARVVQDREITLAGHQGRGYELEIKQPRQLLSGQLVLVGNRLYHLLVIGPGLRGSTPEVKMFFDSFRLTQ